MLAEDAIKTLLSADSSFSALMTGGIYTYSETGRIGLSRQTTPAVYDQAIMKPNVVIYYAGMVLTGEILEQRKIEHSANELIQLRFRTNESGGIQTLQDAMKLSRSIVHGQRLSTGGVALWDGDLIMPIERDLLRAYFFIQMFKIVTVKK